MELSIQLKNDQVNRLLSGIARKLGDLAPVMRQIAGIMQDAVEENFDQEGRPSWKPSRRAEAQGGRTLQDTGRLAASITSRATGNQAMVGTNVVYAAIHQFGGHTGPHTILPKNKKALFWPGARHPVKSVKHPGSDIPARPFLSLTESDWGKIIQKLERYLTLQ